MGILFRRIGGRIIPIKIASEKAGREFVKAARKITATVANTGEPVGTLHVTYGLFRRPKAATITGVSVEAAYRKKGIASALFEHAAKLFGRAGKTTLRTNGIEHAAQVAVREKYNTRFFGHGFGKYQDQTRRLTGNQARQVLAQSPQSKIVTATTLIPKRFRRK